MGFLYFLLVIVVLGAIGYGVAHYLSQKQSKVIEELGVKKQKLMTVPIADILFTLIITDYVIILCNNIE